MRDLRESAQRLLEGLLESLPRLAVAVVILAVGWVVIHFVTRLVRRRLAASRDRSFARVFGGLFRGALTVVLVMAAAAVLFPSVDPVHLLGGVGVVSIAAGFAFQDILQNLLAGVLLLLRHLFDEGDEIDVDGKNGTVEVITLRETQLRTFDGQRYLIPNADVYQSAVLVHTAFPVRRTSVLVGVDYDADLDHACDVALEALAGVSGVEDEPAPQAYLVEFGDSSMVIDLRYWTDSRQAEVRRIEHLAIVAVKRAYDRAGINIPFPIRTLDTRPSFEKALRSSGSSNGEGAKRERAAAGDRA